jgi:diacylglycerol kinase (ATP)
MLRPLSIARQSQLEDSRLDSTCLIINPAAGRGRIRATIPSIRAAFAARGISTAYQTSSPGDEETLARRAIDGGAQTIVAVGGDGTCGRIAQAIVQSKAACRLAVVPSGTGNDFAKTLGVAKLTPTAVAELVVGGDATRIDVGVADGHYFLNSCGFGFDASVLEASNAVRFLKGDAVYIYSALRQLWSYRGVEVRPTGIPGGAGGRMLMVTVSNGKSLGGAFRIAPHASVLDGKLDVCFFADSNVAARPSLFLAALRGTHLDKPQVFAATARQLTLSFDRAPAMEMDGELRVASASSVDISCVPRALSVIAAPGALV